MSRFRRSDDGTIAVLAAIVFPVILLTVALAFAAFVWSSSEHEQQRAADTAAARAAASAFLASDFPYDQVPGATTPVTYPDVQAIAGAAGLTAPPNLDQCGTVGVPPTTDPLPTGVTLPVDCSGVGPFAVPPALGAADESWNVACSTARDAMAPAHAVYATKFYEGSDDPQPSCARDASTGTSRIDVKVATGNPLVGFGQTVSGAADGTLDTQVAPQFATVRDALAAFGIHLDTSLPSLLCPEVSVRVDQPVREPVFDRFSVPNGRATARRVVKNAVVVPIFQGQKITPVSDDAVSAANSEGVDVPSDVSGTTVNIPPQNLNALLLAAQQQLLALLDEVDAISDAAIRAANVTVDRLNGVYTGVDPVDQQPPPLPGTGPLQGLRITKCLRDTLSQIYDPPSGDAPTADEVLANAAATGEQVIAVQVGVIKASCTAPGAIPMVDTPNPSDECIRAATTPQVDPTTGLYEVPFFDATPVLVQDVGDHNYEAVPVHATQASGAFRGSLVRATDDERYDPTVTQPQPTPACTQTLPPDGSTACDILSLSPSPSLPVETPTVSPSLTPSPTPLPTESPTPLPSPTETLSPTPLPTVTLSPSPTCILLCGL